MNKFTLAISFLAFAGCLVGCGATSSTTSSFKVRMLGIHSPPTGADGTNAPRSQTYLLNAITLTTSDGTSIPLFDEDPETFKIIDRGQIIYKKADMSEYDGTAISSVLIKVDPTVVVTSRSGTDTTIDLSSGDLQLDEAFTVTKSKEQVLTVKIAWGDTVSENDDGTETVIPPSFTMKYESTP